MIDNRSSINYAHPKREACVCVWEEEEVDSDVVLQMPPQFLVSPISYLQLVLVFLSIGSPINQPTSSANEIMRVRNPQSLSVRVCV